MNRTLRFLQQAIVASTLAIAACRTGSRGSSVSDDGVSQVRTGSALAHAGESRVIATVPIEPRLQPALEALQAAVDAGDDRRARAVLARFLEMGPTGGALELAHAFERILDGRDAVAALDLKLDARLDRRPTGPAMAGIDFTGVSRDGRSFEVAPGPGTLQVRVTSVDERGDEARSLESVPIDTIQSFPVDAGVPSRLPLVELPFGLKPGSMATRVIFALELRSGSVRVTGASTSTATSEAGDVTVAGSAADKDTSGPRELPAMRLGVAPAELVMLSRELASLPLSGPGDLAALVSSGTCDRRAALSLAVRLPPADRAAALDRLAEVGETIPEPALQALAPSLRWLAPDENLGEDVAAWRAWLRTRAHGAKARPDLQLPRAR